MSITASGLRPRLFETLTSLGLWLSLSYICVAEVLKWMLITLTYKLDCFHHYTHRNVNNVGQISPAAPKMLL